MTAPITSPAPADLVFGPSVAGPDSIVISPRPQAPAPRLFATAHPDKAVSQRATVIAALADGTSRLRGLADCRDVRANLAALTELGTVIRPLEQGAIEVVGRLPSDLAVTGLTLDAGNSATTSRLLLAMLAGSSADCVVTGNELLRGRPMNSVRVPLGALGAEIDELGEPGRLPMRVRGNRLRAGTVTVDVDSAQPVSALLIAALAADGPVRIRRRSVARDHTERLLRWAGVEVLETEQELRITPRQPRAIDLTVPGDPSGAAYLIALFLAAGLGDSLVVRGVGLNPRRTGFLRILQAMGVRIDATAVSQDGPEPTGDLVVHAPAALHGTTVAGSALVQSCIDELPLVAALAVRADRPTVIADAAELRDKDTDRIAETVRLLRAFDARATATPDGIEIEPGPLTAPASLRLPADHRIIFAAFVLALLSGGRTELHGVSAVATSHPGALADLAQFAVVDEP